MTRVADSEDSGRQAALEARAREVFETLEGVATSLDLTRTADAILAGARSLFGSSSASILVRDRGGTTILCERSVGSPDRRKRPLPVLGLVSRALESGRGALWQRDVDETGGAEFLASTRSAMVAALDGAGRRVLGALVCESEEPSRFDGEAFSSFSGYARAAAVAVERALLYTQLLEGRHLEGEMEVARRVMTGLLPRELPELDGLDLAAQSESYYEVGGDYYDFIALGDERWGIAMADVSGKGVSAALVVAAIRASLFSLAKRELALRSILQRANEFVYASGGEYAKYVTLFYAVLDVPARRLIYVNAGHLPPVVLRANGSVELLRSGGFPIGLFNNPRYFEQFVQLKTGDLIALYTDGITEATNAEDEDYGRDRLISVLERERERPAAEISDAIVSDARRFGDAPADDATILILKAT